MPASSHRRFSRRPLLQIGGAGLLGLTLPRLLEAHQLQARQPATSKPSGRAKSVIFLFQWGGPSHVDTFDMKPTAPDGYRSLFTPVSTSVPGLHV